MRATQTPSFVALMALAIMPITSTKAASTLPQTQRLEWSGANGAPTGAQYGARVAIPEVPFGSAGVGAPGSGGFEQFWFNNGTWSPFVSLELPHPQPLAMCSDGEVLFWGEETFEGMDLYTKLRLGTQASFLTIVGPVETLVRDGVVLAVGDPDYSGGKGRVKVYERDGDGPYDLRATFVGGADDRLGAALALDSHLLVAGAPGDAPNGSVKVWVKTTEWIEFQEIESPATSQLEARFGAAVALRGDVLAIGSPDVDRVTNPGARIDVGAVYVYEAEFLLFELTALLRPAGASHEDHVGASVALHDFGPYGLALAFGSPGEDVAGVDEGAAHLFTHAAGSWTHFVRLIDSEGADGDALGTAVALGDLGLLAGAPHAQANGTPDQGVALFFDRFFVLFADGFETGDLGFWPQ